MRILDWPELGWSLLDAPGRDPDFALLGAIFAWGEVALDPWWLIWPEHRTT